MLSGEDRAAVIAHAHRKARRARRRGRPDEQAGTGVDAGPGRGIEQGVAQRLTGVGVGGGGREAQGLAHDGRLVADGGQHGGLVGRGRAAGLLPEFDAGEVGVAAAGGQLHGAGGGQRGGEGPELGPGAGRAAVIVGEHGLAIEGQGKGLGEVVLPHVHVGLVSAGGHGRQAHAQAAAPVNRGLNHAGAGHIGGRQQGHGVVGEGEAVGGVVGGRGPGPGVAVERQGRPVQVDSPVESIGRSRAAVGVQAHLSLGRQAGGIGYR